MWWPQGSNFPDEVATVGDMIYFSWNPDFAHNVYIHPTGTCNETGAIFIGDTPPVNYTFTENDVGSSIMFACDIVDHCELGQAVTVDVVPPTNVIE